ncbi:MAG: hypothetical protein II623_01175 [Paludibacteraceae bacterium]|nr:hypothetical protein [Paludibacteraceae bacterium]
MKKLLFITVCFLFCFINAGCQRLETYANNSKGNQSAAAYGKYLFLVKDKLASVAVYNIEKKSVSCIYSMTPRNDMNGKQTVFHCNQSSFGVEKFIETDSFPLLYVSQRNRSAAEGAMLSVFRVKPEFIEGEMVSFSLEEVQTIYFPVMSDSNCLGNPNVAIDTAKQVMYVYSRNNRKEALNRHKAKLTTFKIPTLRDREGNVVREVRLSDADILSSFSSDFSMVNAQGACAKSGMLYIAQVYSDSLHKRGAVLHKIDMDTQKHTTLDLSSLGFKGEIEGCWAYNGNLMFSSSGKMLYLLHNYY